MEMNVHKRLSNISELDIVCGLMYHYDCSFIGYFAINGTCGIFIIKAKKLKK